MPSVMVVDDSKINREVLARAVERAGYRVIASHSGEHALELFDETEVDIVLLDVVMEGMDGLDVLQHLRARRNSLELPILMISSTKDSPQVVRALDMGANDYLVKPVDTSILLAKLRQYASLRQRPESLGRGKASAPFRADELSEGMEFGHYQLGRLLGEGGMGKVFLAKDVNLRRSVAIKVVQHHTNKEDALHRFYTEARAIARVQHPNVVTIYEIGETPCPYIAMEHIDGKCLDIFAANNPYDFRQIVDWTVQILSALATVHAEGIIHRDLKPGNVMIDREKKAKVMDFGLAKMTETSVGVTNSGSLLGTPQFMAPEQIDSSFGAVDARSDLFSTAGILYLLLTKTSPFPAKLLAQQLFAICSKEPENPLFINEEIPPELVAVCLKGLRKRKDERYQSAQHFIDALEACRAHL